jgi:hypothetical protein
MSLDSAFAFIAAITQSSTQIEKIRNKQSTETLSAAEYAFSRRELMRAYVQQRPDRVAETSSPSGCHTIRRDVAIVHHNS